MRQINIKELKNNLCKELQDLPFEITKYGQVVATIIGNPINKVATTTDKPLKGSHPQKLSLCNDTTKATSSMAGGFFNPQPKAGAGAK